MVTVGRAEAVAAFARTAAPDEACYSSSGSTSTSCRA